MNTSSLKLFAQQMRRSAQVSSSSRVSMAGSKVFTQNTCSRFFSSASGDDILASFKNMDFEGKNVASAMEALANADAVCFDVDSTVIQEEGIVRYPVITTNSLHYYI